MRARSTKVAAVRAERDASRRTEARRGVQGAVAPLPHLESIQVSFGRHDVTGVRARVGGGAADRLQASAYASGDRVAFGPRPDLFVAAHEAAHVVQQRQGANPAPGEGGALERHADTVAHRVVRGQPAQSLLDAVPVQRGGASNAPPVQRFLLPWVRLAWRKIPWARLKDIARRIILAGGAEVASEAALKKLESEFEALIKDLPAVEEVQALIKDIRGKLAAASLVENPAKSAASKGLQVALHKLGDLVLEQGGEAWEQGREAIESSLSRAVVETGVHLGKKKLIDTTLGPHREKVAELSRATGGIDTEKLEKGAKVLDKARQGAKLKKGRVHGAKKKPFEKMAGKVSEVKGKVDEAEQALDETPQPESSLRTATISAVGSGLISGGMEAMQSHPDLKTKAKETGKAFAAGALGDVAVTLTSKLLTAVGVSPELANILGELPRLFVEFAVRKALSGKKPAPALTGPSTSPSDSDDRGGSRSKGKEPADSKGKEPASPRRPVGLALLLMPPQTGITLGLQTAMMGTPMGTLGILQRHPWRPLSDSAMTRSIRGSSIGGSIAPHPPSPVQVMVLIGRRRPGQLYIMGDEDWDAYEDFIRRNPWARHPDFPPG